LTSNSHHESTGHNSHESHSIHSVASHNSHETHSAHSVASHDTHGDHNSHDASSSHDTPAAHTSVASHDAHNAHDTNNAHSPHDTHTAQNDHHTENRKIASEGESHHDAQYTLQIGSFPNLAEAKKQLSALQKAELKAFLHEAAIKGKGKWYRLYLGGYSSREAAEEAGEKYKTENKIHSFIVTKSPS
jgi:cell division septation protein DedD